MKIKQTLFSTFAALAVAAAVTAPATLAQDGPSTIGTVTLNDAGQFDMKFCGTSVDFGSANVTAYEGDILTGALEICFTDTQSYRAGFQVQVQAGDFEYDGDATWQYGEPGIPAENLSIHRVYNTWQGQWGGPTSSNNFPVDVGDIGGWAGSNQQVTSHTSSKLYGGPSSLNEPRYISYAWDGAGTASGVMMPPALIDSYDAGVHNSVLGAVDGTYQVFTVELNVPAGLPDGNYQSEITLTLMPQDGYPN